MREATMQRSRPRLVQSPPDLERGPHLLPPFLCLGVRGEGVMREATVQLSRPRLVQAPQDLGRSHRPLLAGFALRPDRARTSPFFCTWTLARNRQICPLWQHSKRSFGNGNWRIRKKPAGKWLAVISGGLCLRHSAIIEATKKRFRGTIRHSLDRPMVQPEGPEMVLHHLEGRGEGTMREVTVQRSRPRLVQSQPDLKRDPQRPHPLAGFTPRPDRTRASPFICT